jgi:hypothetical protein
MFKASKTGAYYLKSLVNFTLDIYYDSDMLLLVFLNIFYQARYLYIQVHARIIGALALLLERVETVHTNLGRVRLSR